MRNLATSSRFCFFVRAGRLAATVALTIMIGGGCGSVNSAGGDAAAGTSGQGGQAGSGAGGSTGSAGSTGAAGTGVAGTTGTGGSSAGRGGNGGAAGSGGGSPGTGGGSGGIGGMGGGVGGRGGSVGGCGVCPAGYVCLDGGCLPCGACPSCFQCMGGRGGAGGSAGSTGAGGRGGAGGVAGSSGGGGAGGTTSPCQAVLALDRSCTTSADCFAGAHTTDCCGNSQAIGFRNSVMTQFQTLEAQCDMTYPACGCPAGPPIADDGSRLRFSQQPGVACVQGKCTTFVPDCGRPCGAGTTCFSCVDRTQTFAACTTMCTDSNACTDPSLPLCQMGSSGNTSGKFCTAANVACDTK